MAGEVRQPIDLSALERYIDQNVPALKTPLELKQVNAVTVLGGMRGADRCLVWLWSIQPYLPNYERQRQEVRSAQEAPGQAPVEDRTPRGTRVPDYPGIGLN